MKFIKFTIILFCFLLLYGCAVGRENEVSSSESNAEPVLEGSIERQEIWELILVNEQNPIEADYAPPALEKISNGMQLDARIVPAMERMISDAALDGISLVLISAYRPYETQERILRQKINELMAAGKSEEQANAAARLLIALPGTSEHQTGLAADIVTPSYYELTEGFAQTAAGKWLYTHAADYGFILRYPQNKTHLTGISFEPWHYRYVGTEAAREIMRDELCLEEYLAQ